MVDPCFENLEQLAHDLCSLFPDFKNLAPLKRLADGASSIVVEGADGFVFRIGKNSESVDSYRHEAELLPILRSHINVPIPDPRWCAGPTEAFPFGVFGYKKLPGESLQKKRIEALDWKNIAADVGAFMQQLHTVPLDCIRSVKLPDFHGKPSTLADIQARVLPYLKLVLTARECEVAIQWMEQMQIDGRMQQYSPTLVHGDLFYANLLVDEVKSKVTGVVDFENASIGDPAQDFATQYSLGQPYYDAVVGAYIKAGGHIDESLEYRMHQLRILRSIYGLLFFAETGDLIEFADSVYKLRHSDLLHEVAK